MKLNYPKVKTDQNQKVYVTFYYNKKRYRVFNGKRIGSDINPNSFPIEQRLSIGNLLAAEIYRYINSGGKINEYRTNKPLIRSNLTDREFLLIALEKKLKGGYSEVYKKTLKITYENILNEMKGDTLTKNNIETYLNKYSNGTSYNTIRRHLNVLINEAINQGMTHNPSKDIRGVKSKAVLNKPIEKISEVLEDIKAYNKKLYLCCLITYGCLLRPHREVRELTWGDFSDDLHYISLAGSRNKSGRNRIVPVPSYIRDILFIGEPKHNIFSNTVIAPNKSYFNTLWTRYKNQSNLLSKDQTIYSFRHTGAIDIFKRTSSLQKLQSAMGHSSLTVSLTYLRGLEVAELQEIDMPMIYK